MANTPKWGGDATYVRPRHGQDGYVVLRMEILPEMKSQIVLAANDEGVTIKALVNRILDEYFAA